MNPKLPSSISSPQDVDSLLLEVRQYASWFSHNAIKKRVHAKHPSEPPAISDGAKELLKAWADKKPLNTKSFDDLIKTLKDYKNTAPALTVTLAAPATNDIKRTLVSWFRDNVSPNVLVTFKFNSTILGGMVVQFGSHIHDWSFRRQLLDASRRFPEVLRDV